MAKCRLNAKTQRPDDLLGCIKDPLQDKRNAVKLSITRERKLGRKHERVFGMKVQITDAPEAVRSPSD
jgi:hypothetical protein